MQSPTRTTQAEHSRKWKYIPHAINIDGELVPIVEYRPYEYAKRLAETGSSRVGVAKTFGQEVDNTSIVNKMKDQIAKEGGDPLIFHEMIRSLSGTPVEAPFRPQEEYSLVFLLLKTRPCLVLFSQIFQSH